MIFPPYVAMPSQGSMLICNPFFGPTLTPGIIEQFGLRVVEKNHLTRHPSLLGGLQVATLVSISPGR